LAVCGEAARDVLDELFVAADALGIGTALTDALAAKEGLHAYLLDGGPLGSAGILARRKTAPISWGLGGGRAYRACWEVAELRNGNGGESQREKGSGDLHFGLFGTIRVSR
jgi:hypothetical protein